MSNFGAFLKGSTIAVALAAIPLAVACSTSTPVEETAAAEAEVINGTRDNGHPAVLSLLMEKPGETPTTSSWGSCTGTMVRADAQTKIGYILTAAHCVDGTIKNVIVLQGNDTGPAGVAERISYAYLDLTVHSGYNGQVRSPYDIAMIRVLGVGASTPTLPMLKPDTLAQGTRVTSVGFGRTIRPNAPPGDAGSNTFKNRIDGSIEQLTTTHLGVRYDNNGDICQGDSGGPVLTTVNGKEYVVGVHSFVTGPCVGVGYSIRASAHDAFLKTILDSAAPAETCELCKKKVLSGEQACATARKECANDPQCDGLNKCIRACGAAATDAGSDAGASPECRAQCSVEFPYGAAPFNQKLVFCACNECDGVCATDTTCAAVPKCGMKFDRDECTSCMEGACCDEAAKCGADGHCYRCERTPGTPGCETDPLFKKLTQCRANGCTAQCAPKPEGADGGTP